MRMRNVLISFIILFSCGFYSFSEGGYPGISSVAIPLFEDRSAEFQIREKLTEVIVNKFLRDNTLRLVDPEKSDSIIRGTILRIEDRPVAITETEQAQEIEINIYVQVEYEDLKEHHIIFSESFLGRGTYADPPQRNEALEEALEKVSTDILNRVVSGW